MNLEEISLNNSISLKWHDSQDYQEFEYSLTDEERYFLYGQLVQRKKFVKDMKNPDWMKEGF